MMMGADCGMHSFEYPRQRPPMAPVSPQRSSFYLTMTTQDKINYIRQKCIEANPEIVELKFGCNVRLEDYSAFPNAHGTYIGKGFASGIEKIYVLHPDERLYPIDRKFKPLGRPIRLADVCLAVLKRLDIYPDLKVIRWDYRADDLEKQDEETIKFIYELLKG